MSISAVWSVWCDIKNEDCTMWEGEELTKKAARSVVKIRGWSYKWHNGRYIDVCPNCQTYLDGEE